MNRNTLKLFALTSAVALGFAFTNNADAQVGSVQATLTTTSAITVTAVNDLDFGEWFLNPAGDDTITLVMDPQAGTVTDTVVDGGDTTTDGAAVEIVASANVGRITVQTPATATVNMYATISSDFTNGQLSFGTPTYSLNAAATAPLSTNAGAPTSFTATGGVDDNVDLGGTVTVANGAVLADNSHTADIDVTFSY